jgi:hypothetical protein
VSEKYVLRNEFCEKYESNIFLRKSALANRHFTGRNTLRRHPSYVMGLINNPTCKKCGTEEETSAHILCECGALVSLRHTHLRSFFLDPKDIRKLITGAIWNFVKGTGLLEPNNRS